MFAFTIAFVAQTSIASAAAAPTTTTLSASPATQDGYGASAVFTATATVTAGGAAATSGTTTITDTTTSTTLANAVTVNASGVVTATTSALTGGTQASPSTTPPTTPVTLAHTITATYTGNASYGNSSTSISYTITLPATIACTPAAQTITSGASVTVTCHATSPATGANVAAGTIQVFDNLTTTLAASVAVGAGGIATFTTTSITTAGVHNLSFVYTSATTPTVYSWATTANVTGNGGFGRTLTGMTNGETGPWDAAALDTLRAWDPSWSAAAVKVTNNPWTGALDRKTVELIGVAVNAACTNLNGDGTRRHIRRALAAGATRDELLMVLKMASFLSIHTCSLGAPILIEEAKAAGVSAKGPAAQTPMCDRMRASGQWNTAWDPFYDMDPTWTEEFMLCGAPIYAGGVLEPKLAELLSIAFDASYTHMYAPGTRRHIKAALKLGATVGEIMEVLKLCVVQGVQSCNMGIPILDEELARAHAP